MTRKAIWITMVGLLVGIAATWLAAKLWIEAETKPMANGPNVFIRFEKGTGALESYRNLEQRGIVRNASALHLHARLSRRDAGVRAGTYQLAPGMKPDEVLTALEKPITVKVRIPEGWWIRRVAKKLAEAQICTAEEYEELANDPKRFAGDVSFPLPTNSLEGYLFPDTYEFQPLVGAEAVIRLQLKTFEQKVIAKIPPKSALTRLVTIGSLIEAEVADRDERRVVAGVIENRIRKKMRLELDASVLYALQEWKVLGPGVVRTVKSPYNTYLNAGLPPGPICSPGVDSIVAASTPASHSFLFYVAKPDRKHLFSSTYAEHMANIRRARAMKVKQ